MTKIWCWRHCHVLCVRNGDPAASVGTIARQTIYLIVLNFRRFSCLLIKWTYLKVNLPCCCCSCFFYFQTCWMNAYILGNCILSLTYVIEQKNKKWLATSRHSRTKFSLPRLLTSARFSLPALYGKTLVITKDATLTEVQQLKRKTRGNNNNRSSLLFYIIGC